MKNKCSDCKNFIPSCSVHPERSDAIEKLHEYHRNSIKIIKWLPNSMGIYQSNDSHTNIMKLLKSLTGFKRVKYLAKLPDRQDLYSRLLFC